MDEVAHDTCGGGGGISMDYAYAATSGLGRRGRIRR